MHVFFLPCTVTNNDYHNLSPVIIHRVGLSALNSCFWSQRELNNGGNVSSALITIVNYCFENFCLFPYMVMYASIEFLKLHDNNPAAARCIYLIDSGTT